MLCPDIDWDAVEATPSHSDNSLRSRDVQLRLCERLYDSHMLGTCQSIIMSFGLFTVMKNYMEDGSRSLRAVWDGRRPNLLWQAPPWVPLGSPATWSHLDLSQLSPEEVLMTTVGAFQLVKEIEKLG